MSVLDEDNFVIKGRESQGFDKTKLKSTSAFSGNDSEVKVKKIIGIDDDIEALKGDEILVDRDEKPLKKRIRSYKTQEEPKKTWVKPALIGAVVLLLIIGYIINIYFKIKGMQ